jgi:hypothetical protein
MTFPLKRSARLYSAVSALCLGRCIPVEKRRVDVTVCGGWAGTPPCTLLELLPALALQHRQRQATRLRLVGVVRRGWTRILVASLHHQPLPWGTFHPDPWPPTPSPRPR